MSEFRHVYRTELSPVSFLTRSAYVFPDKVAVVHGARRYTYREFEARANRLASALRSEEHTSELQSLRHLVCRLLLERKKQSTQIRAFQNHLAPRPSYETGEESQIRCRLTAPAAVSRRLAADRTSR